MACGSLRGPYTGKPVRVGTDGKLQASVTVDGTVGTKPASWAAGSNTSGAIDDTGTPAFVDPAPGRTYIRMTNTGPNNAFIRPSSGPTTSDTPLLVGDSIEFHGGYDGAWYGITATGESATIAIIEFKA